MPDTTLSETISGIVRRLLRQRRQPVFGDTSDGRAVFSAQINGPAPSVIPRFVPAAKLQLVGLERVKASLGDRWPQLADRVRDVAQTVIKKHLLPGDVSEQHGDDGYLVLFAQLSRDDASFKAEAISREIERRLIGCHLTEIAECRAVVVMVDLEEAEVPENTDRASYNRRPRFQPPALTRAAVGAMSLSVDREFLGSKSGDRARPPLGQDNDGCMVAPSAFPELKEPSLQLERRARPRHTAGMVWCYRPIWDFHNSALVLFMLLPRPSDNTGWDNDTMVDPADMELRAELDIAGIIRAAGDLHLLSKSARRLPLFVQVHYETVANARRQAFMLAAVKKVPPQFQRLLTVEIVGWPRNEYLQPVAAFVCALGGIGIRTAIRIDPCWLTAPRIETCGAKILVTSFAAGWSETEQLRALNLMAERGVEAKLDCGVWNLTTRSMVVAAASAGIRYLSGDAVAKDWRSLSHALRYSLADLYLRG
jgi:hypothetical protein